MCVCVWGGGYSYIRVLSSIRFLLAFCLHRNRERSVLSVFLLQTTDFLGFCLETSFTNWCPAFLFRWKLAFSTSKAMVSISRAEIGYNSGFL